MNNTEQQSYQDLENLAKLLDDKFELGGFRFGISFIIDLFPGIGDIIAVSLALYIFSLANKYNIPSWVKTRMLMNIGLYFLVGLVPLAGDVLAAWMRPNRRNVKLLKKYAQQGMPTPYLGKGQG